MSEFLMPSLGADMDAGTLLEWHVKPGDTVRRGDIVALVDTDKAAIEIEIFEDGVVRELLVPEGEKVPVGTPLAMVGNGVAEAPSVASSTGITSTELVTVPLEVVSVTQQTPHATPAARKRALELTLDLSDIEGTGRHGVINRADVEGAAGVPVDAPKDVQPTRRRVSPLARRLAAQYGVDLSNVTGTGPDGAVTRADIDAARQPSERQPAFPEPSTQSPVSTVPDTREDVKEKPKEDRYAAMRRAIAAAMGRSKREIPHYYLSTYVNMRRALDWLEQTNLARPVTERILPAVLLLKATALAARDVPDVNGFWKGDAFYPSERVNVGVGISLRQGGLIAPAIHDADRKDLPTLMRDLRDLVKRARSLQLRSSELADATLTTTNLGDQGVVSVYGIIYPPQVALVGFGKITPQPWAEGDMVGVRPALKLTLAADHRASDGHRGGLFLAAIDRHLQTPENL